MGGSEAMSLQGNRRPRRRRRTRATIDYQDMSVRYGSIKLQVPPGFKTLLEHLAREVLREQPKDIPEFAAAYFNRLLQRRADGYTDPYLINERIVETVPPETTHTAPVETQADYGSVESAPEQIVETEQNDTSATVEENVKEEEEEMPDLDDPEVQKAATLIQASFRGFHTRKSITPTKAPTQKEISHLNKLEKPCSSNKLPQNIPESTEDDAFTITESKIEAVSDQIVTEVNDSSDEAGILNNNTSEIIVSLTQPTPESESLPETPAFIEKAEAQDDADKEVSSTVIDNESNLNNISEVVVEAVSQEQFNNVVEQETADAVYKDETVDIDDGYSERVNEVVNETLLNEKPSEETANATTQLEFENNISEIESADANGELTMYKNEASPVSVKVDSNKIINEDLHVEEFIETINAGTEEITVEEVPVKTKSILESKEANIGEISESEKQDDKDQEGNNIEQSSKKIPESNIEVVNDTDGNQTNKTDIIENKVKTEILSKNIVLDDVENASYTEGKKEIQKETTEVTVMNNESLEAQEDIQENKIYIEQPLIDANAPESMTTQNDENGNPTTNVTVNKIHSFTNGENILDLPDETSNQEHFDTDEKLEKAEIAVTTIDIEDSIVTSIESSSEELQAKNEEQDENSTEDECKILKQDMDSTEGESVIKSNQGNISNNTENKDFILAVESKQQDYILEEEIKLSDTQLLQEVVDAFDDKDVCDGNKDEGEETIPPEESTVNDSTNDGQETENKKEITESEEGATIDNKNPDDHVKEDYTNAIEVTAAEDSVTETVEVEKTEEPTPQETATEEAALQEVKTKDAAPQETTKVDDSQEETKEDDALQETVKEDDAPQETTAEEEAAPQETVDEPIPENTDREVLNDKPVEPETTNGKTIAQGEKTVENEESTKPEDSNTAAEKPTEAVETEPEEIQVSTAETEQ